MADLKKSEDKITVTEWKNKMSAIHKDRHEKVQSLLTPEQKESLKTTKREHGRRFRQDKHNKIERMKKDLNLTEEQTAAVEKSLAESHQKMKAVHDNKSLTEDQKKAEVKKFKQEQHDNLKSILTEEQWKKFEEQKKHHKHQAGKAGFQS